MQPRSLKTTYFGHRISIEPAEWGYLAEIIVPGSEDRLVAANSSAFRALDDAFEMIDLSLRSAARSAGPTEA